MAQINSSHQMFKAGHTLATLRRRGAAALKWWAEHQAWPATDEIRLDRHRSTCG